MSDMNNSPENQESSPIRGLFRRNEEAYNRHQEQRAQELQQQQQDQQQSVEDAEEVPEPQAPTLGGRLRSFFGRITEMVTMPEDSVLFLDDDEAEDEFAPAAHQNSDTGKASPKKHSMPASALYTAQKKTPEPPEPAADEEEADAGVIYDEMTESHSTVLFAAKKPEADQKKEAAPESMEKPDSKESEKPSSAVKPPRQNDGKTAISIEDIMNVKNSAQERTPMTFSEAAGGKTPAEPSPQPEEKSAPPKSASQPEEKSAPPKSASQPEEKSAPPKPAPQPEEKPAAPKPAPQPEEKSAPPKPAPQPEEKPASPKPAPQSERKTAPQMPPRDFSERRSNAMVYHNHDSLPFVVMAGKFSKTLRGEYEKARQYGNYAAPAAPAPEESHSVDVQPEAEAETEAQSKAAAPEKQQRRPAKKPKEPLRMPKPRRSFRQRFADLFSMDDEFEEELDDISDIRPELDDYNSEEDADEIRSDISENLRKMFIRTIALAGLCVGSVITAVLAQVMPNLFTELIHLGWLIYGAISMLFLLVAVFVSRYPIYSGLSVLLKFKGNSDTPAAVAAVAVTLQSIMALFLPDIFVNGTYHLYSSLVILALLLNSFGKLLIVKRTADNFRFLRRKDARFVGKIYTKTRNAEEFVKDLPVHKPLIAYVKRSRFMSNFLQLSYASDPVEESAELVAPFAAVISLVCGIAFGVIYKDFVGGVSSFALSACITIPMCSLIAINIPMKNLCASTLSKGAMVAGYESVRQFCDTNTIMLDYSQLYPKGSITLSGIKAFNESKIQEAVLAAAAVTFAVNGSMAHAFENIIQDRRNMLPAVDSVVYDDNMGLSGWIGGQRILIGNRALLERHNITPPDEKMENKYRKLGSEITYVSLGGDLVAMFILKYHADNSIAHALRELEDNGVCFVIRTIDPNITAKHIAGKFSLYQRCVRILPTGLGAICNDELSAKEKSTRAYLVTNGRLEAFAAAVSGCIRVRSTAAIARWLQFISMGFGFALVTIISFISGFAKLGSLELLLYTAFWCAALIISTYIARKFF